MNEDIQFKVTDNDSQSSETQSSAEISSDNGYSEAPSNKSKVPVFIILLILLVIALAVFWFMFINKSKSNDENPLSTTTNNTEKTATDIPSNNTTDTGTTTDNEINTNNNDPLTANDINDEDYIMDDDFDELTNYEERVLGTNPNNTDTDGDTYLDKYEVLNGYNPKGEGKSDIFSDNGICQVEYQKLIDKHGYSYADCYGDVSVRTCTEVNKNSNIVMVLDASGSMAAQIKGQSKNSIARDASVQFIENLNDSIKLSVVMYGHKGSNQTSGKNASCSGIEELYKLSDTDRTKAIDAAKSLKAVGYTPIAKSLEKVREIFAAKKGEDNTVVLISDGEETCGGNPVAVSQSLKNDGIKVNVIGFDVGGAAEEQLKNIALASNGTYYSARNLEELTQSLANLSKITCTQKENAWNEGLDSTLNSAIDCYHKIDEESVTIDIEAAVESKLHFCLDYIMTKYKEREKSINDMIDSAYEEGIQQVDELDPTFQNEE